MLQMLMPLSTDFHENKQKHCRLLIRLRNCNSNVTGHAILPERFALGHREGTVWFCRSIPNGANTQTLQIVRRESVWHTSHFVL